MVKNLVDTGKILNYDSCFLNQTVLNSAKQNPVVNDDVNMSQSIDKLCHPYFNHAFWRGGIASTIDDRLSSSFNNIVNKNELDKSKASINFSTDNFTNQINRVKQHIIGFKLYGQESDEHEAQNDKNAIEVTIKAVADERKKLEAILDNLNKNNSNEMIQETNEKEEKIKSLTKENEDFRKKSELRNEQAKDLYKRYNSNFHSSVFGYGPIQSSNQSALMFVSFLMGIIGLIAGGIQISHFIPYPDLLFLKSESKHTPPIKRTNIRY